MDEKPFVEMKEQNILAIKCYTAICVILELAYAVELLKGSRSIGYYALFSVILLLPLILCIVSYAKNKESNMVKYIFATGYSLLYAFVMFTGSTTLTFTYIILLIVLLVIFFDSKLSIAVNCFAVGVNLLSVAVTFMKGDMTPEAIVNAEIQIAVIIMLSLFAIFTARLIVRMNEYKLSEISQEKEYITALLEKMGETSASVARSVETMHAHISTLEESVISTNDAMTEVSGGALKTVEAVREQQIKTETIHKYIAELEAAAQTIAINIVNTEEVIQKSRENMNNLVKHVTVSETASSEVKEEIEALNQSTEQMQSITTMINSIASQTSLLALNASIEAARAGEAGRGFAVVASEISNLAGQTSSATVNISSLIGEINTSLQEVVRSIYSLIESNKEQNTAAGAVAESFQEISDNSEEISKQSETLVEVVFELAGENDSIIESMQNISAVTEEASARAAETLENSHRDRENVQQVSALADSVNRQVSELSRV